MPLKRLGWSENNRAVLVQNTIIRGALFLACTVYGVAHVISWRHQCLRWEAGNGLALCDGCHMWFDNNPILSSDWFPKHFPERHDSILPAYQMNPRIDVAALWREQVGQEAGTNE